jgi:hypothetical protein
MPFIQDNDFDEPKQPMKNPPRRGGFAAGEFENPSFDAS